MYDVGKILSCSSSIGNLVDIRSCVTGQSMYCNVGVGSWL